MRVLVGMSGGVDSSVTAAILAERGYEVIGGTMKIFPDYEQPSPEEGGCCSLDDVRDAKRVAAEIDIPHYTFNLKEVFQEKVIDYFVEEYRNARTPNPCIVCNNEVKFKAFLRKAREIGADYLATGHYARIIHKQKARHIMKKGKDRDKDQTYMLYGLDQTQLGKTLMPLGDLTKEEVRGKARESGLPVFNKQESQEICFIPDNDYVRFLTEYQSDIAEPGPILDTEGNKLGEHQGLYRYTIGQRRGLGISMPYPVYVTGLDKERNALIVGRDREVFAKGLIADHLNWVSISPPDEPITAEAKIRYNASEFPAEVIPGNNGVKVIFAEEQRAVTPGQSVVFYDREVVLGGGVIRKRLEKL